jgi:hypothetical protein
VKVAGKGGEGEAVGVWRVVEEGVRERETDSSFMGYVYHKQWTLAKKFQYRTKIVE